MLCGAECVPWLSGALNPMVPGEPRLPREGLWPWEGLSPHGAQAAAAHRLPDGFLELLSDCTQITRGPAGISSGGCLAYIEGRVGEQAVECARVGHTHMCVHAWRGQTSSSGVQEPFVLGFCFVSDSKVSHGDLRLADPDTSASQGASGSCPCPPRQWNY